MRQALGDWAKDGSTIIGERNRNSRVVKVEGAYRMARESFARKITLDQIVCDF